MNHQKQIKLLKNLTTGKWYHIAGMKNLCVVIAKTKVEGGWKDTEYRVGQSMPEDAVQELLSHKNYQITITNK